MMNKAHKPQTKTRKRDVFAELSEGFAALAEAREGKRTLRTHAIAFKPAPELTPEALLEVRESLHLSRALFATYLRNDNRILFYTQIGYY